MLSIGNLAMQLTTPLLLRKPCKLFASAARVCQRQLGFLVFIVSVLVRGSSLYCRVKAECVSERILKILGPMKSSQQLSDLIFGLPCIINHLYQECP